MLQSPLKSLALSKSILLIKIYVTLSQSLETKKEPLKKIYEMDSDSITKAAILLNAARIHLNVLKKLHAGNYDTNDLFKGDENLFNELGINYNQQQKLYKLLNDSWPDSEIERVYKTGARFITAFDHDYPSRLFDLKNPPVGLYIKGHANLDMPSASIVGTRKPSAYGQIMASGISKALSNVGMNIISGGARGIDAAAHRGSLEADGITIAVFGTGIDRVYPAEHRDLFNRIIEHGAVISEYPTRIGGEAWHFPERNRIIVALSKRVVIVESKLDGGAMHSAKIAQELDREIWSVPGRVTDENSKGTNKLIHDGAKILSDIDEFVRDISGLYGQLKISYTGNQEQEQNKYNDQNLSLKLSGNEKIIYTALQRENNITLDKLLNDTGLDLAILQTGLLTLSASGLVFSTGAGRYSACV